MTHVTIPATGSGDATPQVATDQILTTHYQYLKLADGTIGGSQPAIVNTDGSLQVAVASHSAMIGASVSNFPGTQPVSGNVTASVIGYLGASVANFPATQSVQGYMGASVANFPATQSVQGYMGASVANLPANQQVTIASASITQPISGYVGASLAGGYVGASVPNFPATQSIQGYVGASVANFPGTQPVSGNVTASVIGYIGASIVGGSVNAYNVGGSSITIPAAAPVAGLGASPMRYITGASVNNVLVKNAAGTLYNVTAMNTNINPRYLKLYDKATTPSVGSDLPRQTYVLPGASAGAGAVIPMPVGILFAAGIGFGVTAGSMGDTDATVTSLGDVAVNLGYS